MSVEGVAGLIAAVVASVTAAIGAVWKWGDALEKRAYDKARAEAILREAQEAIAAKNNELAAKDTALADRDAEITRLHGRIASLGATVEALAREGRS